MNSVMFSVTRVCQVCLFMGGGSSHVTIIHDALCLTVQGPPPFPDMFKIVDYEVRTVSKRVVRILLECFLIVNVSITSNQKCSEVVSWGSDLGRAHVLGVYGSKPILSSTILAQ